MELVIQASDIEGSGSIESCIESNNASPYRIQLEQDVSLIS